MIDPKILRFAQYMQNELDANARKGDWETFNDVEAQIYEVKHHVNKLNKALDADKMPETAEYCADIANYCMMIMNTCGMLNSDTPVVFSQKPNLNNSGFSFEAGV